MALVRRFVAFEPAEVLERAVRATEEKGSEVAPPVI